VTDSESAIDLLRLLREHVDFDPEDKTVRMLAEDLAILASCPAPGWNEPQHDRLITEHAARLRSEIVAILGHLPLDREEQAERSRHIDERLLKYDEQRLEEVQRAAVAESRMEVLGRLPSAG
jgi:hypothetical protein